MPEQKIEQLEAQLNDFDRTARDKALQSLIEATRGTWPAPVPYHVNMHCHTFYSYNGYGASPAMIAWRARKEGWGAAAICDFDVLDGMDEFLAAGDRLELKTAVHMETRVFFPEFATQEINSPGEPGVYYFMGAGFVRTPPEGTPEAETFHQLRLASERRNRELLQRVNDYLRDCTLDYDADVLPLTPAGNATERHICEAYYIKSKKVFPERQQWTAFWAESLGIEKEKVDSLYDNPPAFSDTCRSKLMKKGGPGYMQPDAGTFPTINEVIAVARSAGAIPMATWLDGFSEAEQNLEELLKTQTAKGIAALN
ncbi:MAG: hypothetical protein D6820_08700, partial [Lentisphaerae bacterium]